MRPCVPGCFAAIGLLLLTPPLGAEPEPDPDSQPLLRYEPGGMLIEAPFAVTGRLEGANAFPVELDRNGRRTLLEADPGGNVQARVGLSINTRRALIPFNLGAVYEHDLITGPIGGESDLAGDGLPNSEGLAHQLRKAYGRVSLGYYLHLTGGLMTSHWGMGLLANDGGHGWTPGSARFTDPRGGDRVIRVALATGPVTRLRLFAALGYDWIPEGQDDVTVVDGDSARQLIAAFALGRDLPHTIGLYGVWRRQEAADGDLTEVGVVDLHARTSLPVTERLQVGLEVEAAFIFGDTGLASSPELPEKNVLQIGVAARASMAYRSRVGVVLDFLYASGDGNLDDGQQNAFKPDPNFELGLLLYRHVLAGVTGRVPYTAADPNLVGKPAEDLDRFPTRGSASNTIALFPRMWWRPAQRLELYTGPLFAFTAADLIDPLNTRLAGGAPRNAFDAAPGRFLGAELDAGVRFEMPLAGTVLGLGAEGGVFVPGGAFAARDGVKMNAVPGGRLFAGYRF